MMTFSPFRSTAVVFAVAALAAACGSDGDSASGSGPAEGDGSVTIYSGREEELVGPLIEQFESDTGIETQVRYASTTELVAQILDEGDRTPAHVFLAQDAGALGALSGQGRLATLPEAITSAVTPALSSTDGSWVGVTGRARVLAYDGQELSEADLPTTVAELTDPVWKGRVGIAPTNASFQAFVTAFRVLEGEEAARTWLEGMVANDAQVFDSNGAIVEAVNSGSLDVGLINHYYWFELVDEIGAENARIQIAYLDGDDPGSLVNATGAGVLDTVPDDPDALAFVEYLISDAGQEYFVENTFEYSVLEDGPAPEGLKPLDEVGHPDIDLADLDSLEETTALIESVGLGV